MRLSEWRRKAPGLDRIDNRVAAVLKALFADFGAEPDPDCYFAWGDDPEQRYSVLAAVPAGMVSIAVRNASGSEDARATARLTRWPKLAIGEFSIDATGDHRILAVQLESYVLKGVDDEADLIAEFIRGLVLEADNRASAPVTADIVKALTQSIARIAVPVAAAPAPPRAAVARSASVARAVPSTAPRPAARRPRETPEEIALKPAAVRSPRARPTSPEPAGQVAPAEAPPEEPPVGPVEARPAEPAAEPMALVVVEIEPAAEEAEPVAATPPVAPAAPRKPRAPRKPAAEATDKPKRPRRVHREWPQPADSPGWDGPLPANQKSKKKPQRWAP
jgi:hypothetical protein